MSKTEKRHSWSDWTASVTSAEASRLIPRSVSGGSLSSEIQRCPSPSELSVTSELGRLSVSGYSPTSNCRNAWRKTPSRPFHKELSYSTIAEDIDIAPIGNSVTQTVGHSSSGYVTVDDLSVGEKHKWETSKKKRRFSAVPFERYQKSGSGLVEPLTMSSMHSHAPDDFLLSVRPLSSNPRRLQPVGSSSSISSSNGFGAIGKRSWSSCPSSRKSSADSWRATYGTTECVTSGTPRRESVDDGPVGMNPCDSVVEAILLDGYDECLLKKTKDLKRRVNASTNWDCLFAEQDPCVLVVMLKTWLQLLSVLYV